MPYSAQSQLEKRFKTCSVYKRSRQYFDITKLNNIEHREQLQRRKPTEGSVDGTVGKFEDSFYSSELKMYQRVQTQLTKCSTRTGKDEDQFGYAVTYMTQNKRKGKTLDMGKMLSRNYYDKAMEFNKNQNHFCNFAPYKLPNNHTINFQKFLNPGQILKIKQAKIKSKLCTKCNSRSDALGQTPAITEPQVGKVREKMLYNESLFKTLVDFKKNDKQKSHREMDPQIEINMDRIRLGQQVSQKHPNLGQVQFYHGNSKWSAPQMDNRITKTNEYSLKIYNKKEADKRDWLMQKRKTDLMDNRIQKIMARKRIQDIKGQICDQIYFRRNKF